MNCKCVQSKLGNHMPCSWQVGNAKPPVSSNLWCFCICSHCSRLGCPAWVLVITCTCSLLRMPSTYNANVSLRTKTSRLELESCRTWPSSLWQREGRATQVSPGATRFHPSPARVHAVQRKHRRRGSTSKCMTSTPPVRSHVRGGARHLGRGWTQSEAAVSQLLRS